MFSRTALFVGLGLGVVAFFEFKGRRLLQQLDTRAPLILGVNQIAFAAILVGYCAWSIQTNLDNLGRYAEAIASNPQLTSMLGPIDDLHRTVTLGVYGSVAILSCIFQGSMAAYYFTQSRHLRDYVEGTPDWVLDLQRATSTGQIRSRGRFAHIMSSCELTAVRRRKTMTNRLRPTILFSSFYERHLIADGLARLRALGDVREVNRGRNLTREELLEFLPEAQVCVAADENYDADLLDQSNDLALIAREGTGYDGVDIEAATARGILVTNAPAVHHATANLTIGLMIALVRKIIPCDRGVREGHWTRRDLWNCPDLTGMTLGIAGLGLSGREVARRAIAMGMRVLAFNRSDVAESARDLGAEVASLDDLLARSDVVTVHIRHSPESERLFDAALFAKMKKGAYFINVARGGLVDEAALRDALKRGHLTGAAIDVMAHEPPERDNPLLAVENLICTPHVGGETTTTVREAFDMAVDQVFDCFEGRKPQHLVNPDAWDGARIRELVKTVNDK